MTCPYLVYQLSFYLLAFSRHVIPGTVESIDRAAYFLLRMAGRVELPFPLSISVEAVVVCICYN